MIVEAVVLGAAALGLSAIAARWGWKRRARGSAQAEQAAARSPRPAGLAPGDVLSYDGVDLVLERGSELVDGARIRVLVALSVEPRYAVQLDDAGERVVLASPYDALPMGRVADVVEVGARSLSLVCRGDAAAADVVVDRGLLRGRVRFTMLADRAGRHLVVLEPDEGERLALLGDLVDPRRLDVLPGS